MGGGEPICTVLLLSYRVLVSITWDVLREWRRQKLSFFSLGSVEALKPHLFHSLVEWILIDVNISIEKAKLPAEKLKANLRGQ